MDVSNTIRTHGGLTRAAPATDASAAQALAELDRSAGPISGTQMIQAIARGIADKDGQAAGREHATFARWANQNQEKLTPEAKRVLEVYSKVARETRAGGASGLTEKARTQMLAQMREAAKKAPPSAAAKDKSVRGALAELDRQKGPITGRALVRAIEEGTRDKDHQAAGKEYDDFARWAKASDGRLTPEARAVMKVYARYTSAARANGETGLPTKVVDRMLASMRKAAGASGDKPRPSDRLDHVLKHPNEFFKRQAYSAKYNPHPDELDSKGRRVFSYANGNCGPTSLAMAVKAFGLEQARVAKNPEDSIDLARNAMTLPKRSWNTLREPKTNDVGTDLEDYIRGANRLGLRNEKLRINNNHPLRALDEAFKQGRMVLLGGQPGKDGANNYTAYEKAMRTRSGKTDYSYPDGHAILVMGKDARGRYLVADPLSRNGVVHMTAAEMASFRQWYGISVWR